MSGDSSGSNGTRYDGLHALTFEDSGIKAIPSEKQPQLVLSWLSDVIGELKKYDRTTLTGDHQRFVATELGFLIDFIVKSKEEKEQLTTKAIRTAIAKTYEIIYSANASTELYETTNKLLAHVNAGKSDKYTELKQ
ncbi:hypothetical protein AWJ20_2637 [Sugiyamaella lignohabitans]|uniref:Uncharacterized protein n=1 Tax=Sugiyamaella lignohabitans TaxID=796027 RepID=A0A161HMK4_9ASCO|nr:uncharacterized protein AWJ20_2637 [Sugiyamaella lignohabitans]ANB15017.1 hypothetical protein AWJ20_2637 [Sugiyamaella lignohabitans]